MKEENNNDSLLSIKELSKFLRLGETKTREVANTAGFPVIFISPRTKRFRKIDVEKWLSARKSC